jgi:tetratricopeptide (TPR) repeat protein
MKRIFTASFYVYFISMISVILIITETSFSQTNPLVVSGMAKQKKDNYIGAIADYSGAINKNEPQVQQYLKKSGELNAEKTVDSSFAIPYYLRGVCYSAIGKNNDALNDLNTAISINSKFGAAYYERGRIEYGSGKKDEGCIDLGRASSLGDSAAKEIFDEYFCWKDAVIAHTEAVSKLRLNEYQGALNEIQIALKFCPDSARYLALRGRSYLGLGENDLAMADFNKSISLSANNPEAYYGRGSAYYMLKKYQEAFDDLSKAIQLDSKFIDAYLYRAYACEGLEKNQSALFDYQQVMRLKPYDPLAYFKSGLLKNSMNDKKGACRDFNKAATLGNTEAADYAAQCK